MNDENEFRKEIKNSISSDMHLIDIPDEGKRLIKLLPDFADLISKNIVEKPYDLAILHKGTLAALELKNIDNQLTFNKNKVAAHQYKSLKQAKKSGGLGFVLVRFKKGLKASERKRLKTSKFNIDKAYAIDVEWLEGIEDSLSIEYLDANCIILEKDIFTSKYDLKVLWKKIKTKK